MSEPLVGGTNYAASIFYDAGDQGWTEGYTINASGGVDQFGAVANRLKQIITLRKTMLPSDVQMVGARISAIKFRGKALPYAPPELNLGLGAGAPSTAYPGLGWNGMYTTLDGEVHGKQTYRGWNDDQLNFSAVNGLRRKPPNAVANWALQMRTILTTASAFLGVNTRFVIDSFERPTVLKPLIPFTDVTEVSTGILRFTIADEYIPRFVGVKDVQVNVDRTKCVRGLAGRAKVIRVDDQTGGTAWVRVRKNVCCGSAGIGDITGTLMPIVRAFYPIDDFFLLGVGTRKPGRTFFVPAGRQSGKCC